MQNYQVSEQLFIDVWKKHNCPDEVYDGQTIYEILNELVFTSEHKIVLDHYSHINFDEIIKIEYEGDALFKFYWLDNDEYRIKNLNHELTDDDKLIWWTTGFCTYEYLAIDIKKIKFVKLNNHIFILIQSNMVSEKEMRKKIIKKNKIIDIEKDTKALFTRYTFWEGDPAELKKIECIANNLPYYVCIIQPKEKIPNVDVSKRLLLFHTIQEINERLKNVGIILDHTITDTDELFSKGNIVRTIMEYALKHFCVVTGIPLEIEQKYGYIDLGELRKKIKQTTDIDIPIGVTIIANELSHDSGKKYSLQDVRNFHCDVVCVMEKIQKYIYNLDDSHY